MDYLKLEESRFSGLFTKEREMKRILLTLALVPMALSMTSFNPATKTQSSDFASTALNELSDQVGDAISELGERLGTIKVDPSNASKGNITIYALVATPDQKVDGDDIEAAAKASSTKKDTSLVTIRTEISGDLDVDGLEAKDLVDCDCKLRRTFPTTFRVPTEIANDPAKLKAWIGKEASRIREDALGSLKKYQQARIDEKDCNGKDDDYDKVICKINAVNDSKDRTEKNKLYIEIKNILRKLAQGNEDDMSVASELLNELRGDSKLRRIKKSIETILEAREEINTVVTNSQEDIDALADAQAELQYAQRDYDTATQRVNALTSSRQAGTWEWHMAVEDQQMAHNRKMELARSTREYQQNIAKHSREIDSTLRKYQKKLRSSSSSSYKFDRKDYGAVQAAARSAKSDISESRRDTTSSHGLVTETGRSIRGGNDLGPSNSPNDIPTDPNYRGYQRIDDLLSSIDNMDRGRINLANFQQQLQALGRYTPDYMSNGPQQAQFQFAPNTNSQQGYSNRATGGNGPGLNRSRMQ